MAADPIWASVNTDGTFVSPKVQAAIDARSDRPFPQADLGLDGAAEQMAEAGAEDAPKSGAEVVSLDKWRK